MAHKSTLRITLELEVNGDKSTGFDWKQYLKIRRENSYKILAATCVCSTYISPTEMGIDNDQLQRLRSTNLHKSILKEIVGDKMKIVSRNSKAHNSAQKYSIFDSIDKNSSDSVRFTFDGSKLIIGSWYHGHLNNLHMVFDLNEPDSIDKAKKLIEKATSLVDWAVPNRQSIKCLQAANAILKQETNSS